MTEGDVQPEGPGELTSTSLLQRALARDNQAWASIVKLYAPLVYRWCRKWKLQHDDAENITQEVFVAAFENLNSFSKDRGSGRFRAWLYTIAWRRFLDFIRRRQDGNVGRGGSEAMDMMALTEDANPQEPDISEQEELQYLSDRALEFIRSEFSDQDWRAFHNVIMLDQNPQQVADQLGVTVNVVYLAKSRILKRLREYFEGLID